MLERRAGGVGLSAAAAESGVQGWRAPVEGAAGWSRGRRGRVTRAAEKKGRRERGKEREKEKEKKKKMGKKEKKEEGREIKGERGGERVGADRGRGRPRVVSAACDAQANGQTGRWDSGRFGYRLGSSGHREVRREMNQERDRAQRRNKNLAHDLF